MYSKFVFQHMLHIIYIYYIILRIRQTPAASNHAESLHIAIALLHAASHGTAGVCFAGEMLMADDFVTSSH